MMTRVTKQILLTLLLATALFIPAVSAQIEGLAAQQLTIRVGELETVNVKSLTRISLTNPSVADVVNMDENEILVIGKAAGQTTLFVWDDEGKRPIQIQVIEQDLDTVRDRLNDLLGIAEIKTVMLDKNAQEGKVVMTGEVPADKAEKFAQIITPFSANLMDLTKPQDIEDLVQVDMQITELNSTLSQNLGVDWSAGDNNVLALTYEETMPTATGDFEDLFKIGDFNRTSALLATINALIEEGKAQILSKPKLVVVSGEEARFLVGGEIPIRTTTTTSSGGTQENVSFKEFGVGMTITPTIKDIDKIDVLLDVEVSDVDPSNSTDTDVAFTTRTAQTRLHLDNKQTIVMAGLIRKSESLTVRRVPILGKIPVVGFLFSNRSKPTADQDQELVISMTPTILPQQSTLRAKVKEMENAKKGAIVINPNMTKKPEQVAHQAIPYMPNIPAEMVDYVNAVQDKLSASIIYPREAQEYGWEGTAKVNLLILYDGTLAMASIKESSGFDVFDEFALNTAKDNAPYANFPSETDLRELNITIPIVYSLKNK